MTIIFGAGGREEKTNKGTENAMDRQTKIVRIIFAVLLVTVLALGVFLGVTSFLVRHTANIVSHPWRFALELLIVGASATPLVLIAYLRRGIDRSRLPLDMLILTGKLVVAWVLFELSGVNETLFPKLSR